MFVPLTPLSFKRRAVQLFGNRVGVVDGSERFTYAEFGQRTNRLANALLANGLQAGDRVACLAYNSYPLLEGYYGVIEAGGILLPINIRLTPDEIAYILNDAGVSYLLVDQDFVGLLESLESRLRRCPYVVWLSGRPEGRPEPMYDSWLDDASADPPPEVEIDENAVAELFYTSGTTGRPKGVMLTHRNLYLHAMTILSRLIADESDVQLHSIPLFHVNGWGTPQYLTAVGGRHVMMRKFDPGEALRLIETEDVTRMLAVPTMLNMLLEHPDIDTRNLSSLRFINIGGAPAAPDMVRRAEAAFGCPVFAGYGLSETTPVLTVAVNKSYLKDEEGRIERQASTGMPLLGVDLRIVDDVGNALPWDGQHEGEIVVRSNVVMKGYWGDEESTRAVLRDGWFHTGDIATVDSEGYVLIVDRKKDIIISGGENISSVEIEKVLYSHPGVLESAVVGVPDERWGEVPRALITLRADSTVTEAEILEFCRTRMAPFKAPKSVEFFTSLPKGGTGKILKARLREPYWSAQSKRVN